MTDTHGYARYASHNNPCRCQVCRDAKAAYVRERRRAGKEPDARCCHDPRCRKNRARQARRAA